MWGPREGKLSRRYSLRSGLVSAVPMAWVHKRKVAPQRRCNPTQRNRSQGDAADAGLQSGGIEIDQPAEGPAGLAEAGEEPAFVQSGELRDTDTDDGHRLANDKRKVCVVGEVAAFELERKSALAFMGDASLPQLVAKAFFVGTAQEAGSKRAVNLLCTGENLRGGDIKMNAMIDRGNCGGRRKAR